jgi:hypothetical protein
MAETARAKGGRFNLCPRFQTFTNHLLQLIRLRQAVSHQIPISHIQDALFITTALSSQVPVWERTRATNQSPGHSH